MKLLYGAVVLACAPFVVAGNDAVYPTKKVAAFVFEKVDLTSLPSAIRPKPVRGKKTFSDYGYVAGELGEKSSLLEPPQGASKISIEVFGSTEIWDLRMCEQSNDEQNRRAVPTSIFAEAEKWRRTS